MNSILSSIKKLPASVVSTAVMMIRSHSRDGKTLFIVEGYDDKQWMSKFYSSENVGIYVCGGCFSFEQILKECNGKYQSRYIIIKDADFDHLNGSENCYPNLFLTDTHDAETMMMNQDMCNILSTKTKYDVTVGTIDQVMSDLKPLSYIKWYNSINNLKLRFKTKCKVGSLFTGCNTVSEKCWLDQIYSDSHNNDKIRLSDNEITNFEKSKGFIDLKQLTNGHDLLQGLSLRIRCFKPQNLNEHDVRECVLQSFDENKYKETAIYLKIKEWAKNNGKQL